MHRDIWREKSIMEMFNILIATVGFVFATFISSASWSATNTDDYLDHSVDAAWDVTMAKGDSYTIDFETEEGTWMSLDISPDGRWIVFDLLGNIYRVPSTGGEAEQLTQDAGISLNFHPRYSPDGKQIAFISDRNGQNNLWAMRANGSDPKPIFEDPITLIHSPAWTPDGKAIIAVREFPTYSLQRRSQRIWRFPVDSVTESPRELVGEHYGVQAAWPTVSNDSTYVYYQHSTFAEPLHGVQSYQQIRSLNLATSRIAAVTRSDPPEVYKLEGVTAFAPELSPDGRWLAFARRLPGAFIRNGNHTFRGRTALWLRNLKTGEDRILMDPISLDMKDAHAMKNSRIIPGYSWAKDSKSIVISQGGKLRRVFVKDGRVETIPFKARVVREVSEKIRPVRELGGMETARMVRWPNLTPDREHLIFQAVGKLWIQQRSDDAEARRLINGQHAAFEFMPVLSPDGERVAYVTWNDEEEGSVRVVDVQSGVSRALTQQKGAYLYPAWSPNGRELYAIRTTTRAAASVASGFFGGDPLSYERIKINVSTKSVEVIQQNVPPLEAFAGPEGRLFTLEQRGLSDVQRLLADGQQPPDRHAILSSFDPKNPQDRREHIRFPVATQAAVSLSGEWYAFVDDFVLGFDLYVMNKPSAQAQYDNEREYIWDGPSGPIDIVKKDPSQAIKRIGPAGAIDPNFDGLGRLVFAAADTIYVYDPQTGELSGTKIRAPIESKTPKGVVRINNAQVITMTDKGVLESADVVYQGSRLTCVGDCGGYEADFEVDGKGKTVIPGFVDVHAHYYLLGDRLYSQRQYIPALYLSYGVTTTVDPAARSFMQFPIAELIEDGQIVGTRMLSTGENLMPISPQTGPSTYEDAERIVKRIHDQGGVGIKIYLMPRRDQRQMLAEAARKYGLYVTNEGGDLEYTVGAMLDGNTGFEHPLQMIEVYDDITQFLAETDAVYSPTLVVSTDSEWLEEYYQSRSNLWMDPRQQRFMPWERLMRAVNFAIKPIEEYSFPLFAEAIKKFVDAGVTISLGGHGQQWGIDSHWDLWGYAETLKPLEALRVATMGGAYMVGLNGEIGSLETGKLADLVILNQSPLDDIKNSTDIAYVIKAGVVYDPFTLDTVWPNNTEYGALPWATRDIYRSDTRSIDYWDK